ncbi:MAG: septum formation family protein [Acidimicrobiales bacterium]
MSDTPRGPGWWRASDGRYYPPEAKPGQPVRPRDEADAARGAPREQEPTVAAGPTTPDRSARPEPVVRPTPAAAAPDDEVALADPWVADPEPPTRRRRSWIPVVIMLALLVAAVAAAAAAVWFLVLDADSDAATTAATETTTTTVATTTTVPDESDDETTTQVSAFALSTGDCFVADEIDDGQGGLVTSVELVSCSEPHLAVVYGTEELDAPADAPFPGIDDRDVASRDLCEPGFESYVGAPLSTSELVLMWLAPTPDTWDEGDRDVSCAVAAPEGELLTEPVQGSGR